MDCMTHFPDRNIKVLVHVNKSDWCDVIIRYTSPKRRRSSAIESGPASAGPTNCDATKEARNVERGGVVGVG